MLIQQTAQAIISALDSARFELVPADGVADRADDLPRSVRLTVTCSPRHGMEPTIDTVEHLARLGFDTVPHIAARMVSGPEHLSEIMERLQRADVRNIYVIGGDARDPLGPYPGALDLLHAIEERGDTFRDVGVAAYPEGHPFISDDELWSVLLAKQPLATYMVTQMCFDPDAITRWAREARERGIGLPCIIGIPGVASRTHLLRMAAKIGVGDSARFLGKHAGMLSRLIRPGAFTPDDLLDGLSGALSDPALDIRGLHVYTFNNIAHTEEWRQRRLASAFT